MGRDGKGREGMGRGIIERRKGERQEGKLEIRGVSVCYEYITVGI